MTEDQKNDYEKRFAEEQQRLLEGFKTKLSEIASEAIGKIYTDVSNYAVGDAHINFYNLLRDEAREEFRAEIVGKYGQYSWAHDLRMLLLEHHKSDLSNKIIEDLQEKISSLKEHVQQLQEWNNR